MQLFSTTTRIWRKPEIQPSTVQMKLREWRREHGAVIPPAWHEWTGYAWLEYRVVRHFDSAMCGRMYDVSVYRLTEYGKKSVDFMTVHGSIIERALTNSVLAQSPVGAPDWVPAYDLTQTKYVIQAVA